MTTKGDPRQEAEKVEYKKEIWKKLNDPNYLPSREDINLVLEHSLSGDFDIDEISKWSKLFNKDRGGRFEMLNKELIEALGNYLLEKIRRIATKDKPAVILELGAGDGRFGQFIDDYLAKHIPGQYKFVATDSGDWKIKPIFPVEKADYKTALQEHSPDMVLVAWMPPGIDWSQDIRQTPSVREYVLMGETENDICGISHDTWGNHEDEGFGKTPMEAVSSHQMGKFYFDERERQEKKLQTVSFEKI
ncbi:MAG: hypothetical protein WA057_02585 [Candidatus Magasanikiibacteriota bacterium]